MCCCGNFSMYSRSQTVIQDVSCTHFSYWEPRKMSFLDNGTWTGRVKSPRKLLSMSRSHIPLPSVLVLLARHSGSQWSRGDLASVLSRRQWENNLEPIMINAQSSVLLGFVQRRISNLHTVVKKLMFLFRNHKSSCKELVVMITKWE